MKTIQQVIWDWNGTLWDDAGLCTEINNNMLRRRGMAEITLQFYRDQLVFPISDYYDRLGFDYSIETYEGLADEYIAEYTIRRFECPLRNGGRELLAYLQQRNVPQAVLSAYEQGALLQATDYYELTPYFTEVIGLDDIYAAGKVENGLKYMAKLGVDPESVLFIGDTIHDFEVAQAMGVHCVLVAGGHNSKPRLESCGVPVFESLHDVRAHIHELIG